MRADLSGPEVSIELDGAEGDIEPFAMLDDLAERAQVAYLVEMDHFIHEKFEFRLLCLRYLASRGWTVFGEEIDPRVGARIDGYLRTGDDALLDPIDEPDWYTRGVLRQAVELHPKLGMEVEQRRFAEALRRTVPDARWFGFDIGGDDVDYLELANASETYGDLAPAMALREERMHERVEAAMRDHAGEKVALMAGSTHLMKDDDAVDAPVGAGPGGDTQRSIGHHVNNLVSGRVLSIWMLHGRGRTSSPWVPDGALAAQPRTVDASLASQGDDSRLIRVDADRRPRKITQMHNLVMTCRLADQVDAIVFSPEVSPLHTA